MIQRRRKGINKVKHYSYNMKFRISDIEIKNFYSFKNAKYHNIKDYNVIIGKNNAGKSNLFKLLDNFIALFKDGKIEKNYLYNENVNLDAYLSITFKLSKEYREVIFKDIYNEEQFSNAFSDPRDCPKAWGEHTLKWLIEEGFYSKIELKFDYYDRWQTLILSEINAIHKNSSKPSILFKKNEGDPSEVGYNLIDKSEFMKKKNLREYFLTTLSPTKDLTKNSDNTFYSFFNRLNNRLGDISSKFYNPLLYKILTDLFSLFRDSFIHHLPDFRKFMRANDIDDIEKTIISQDGSNIGKLLISKKANEPPWHNEVNKDFVEFFEEIEEFTSRIEDNSAIFHLKEKGLDSIFRLENLGAGVLNIVLFLIYLKHLEKDKIILIEEPELFIFPGLQKKLREKLLSFSKINQVFITTHSPNFLTRNFKKCSIYKIKKEDNHSIIDSISDDNLLDVFRELDLTFYDYILYDGILFVEGSKDIEVFKVINEEIFENNLKLIPTEGKNNFIHYASANIIEFLDNNSFNFLFIMDRDRGNKDFYKRIKDKKRRELVKKRIIPLFTYEIENLFLQPILLLDYLYCKKKTKDIKEDFKWLLVTLEDSFKLLSINNFEYIIKKLNDIINPKLSKEEIKEILYNYDDFRSSKDLPDYFYERFNFFMKKKLRFFENPLLKHEDFFNEIHRIQNQYDDFLQKEEYNKVLAGKKVLKKLNNEIRKRYHLEDFSLEKLTRHLISFLDDLYTDLEENIYLEDDFEHPLLEKRLISKFMDYVNNIIKLLNQIKSKTKAKLNIQTDLREINKSILIQFIISRWDIGNNSS